MSVPMAIVDYIPVLFFIVSAIMIQRGLYAIMSKGAFALLSGGTIMVIAAGLMKATGNSCTRSVSAILSV